MNADAFRHFYEYHFAENRNLWDAHVVSLTQEQFTQPVDYSVGSVRNQIVHLINVDTTWFTALRGEDVPEWLNPDEYADRGRIRAPWDTGEAMMRE